MSHNSFGQYFTVTTAGESHGQAYVAIVDGCPPGLALSEADIQPELDRRRPGQSQMTTQRNEPDQVSILSGVFEGKTTGAPIALLIYNTDQKPKDYSEIKNKFRPGHADYTYHHKYGHRDYRGGGRASARETMLWVAAGAIAKKLLRKQGVEVIAYLKQLGEVELEFSEEQAINQNPFFSPDPCKNNKLEELIKLTRKEGDSIGARVSVIARGVPVGLGDPVFNKLDARIALAMMGIPAAKGVEIGDGFNVVSQKGSEHRDEMTKEGFLSNHAGGTLGGISTGQNILASVAFKPTSSIVTPAKTLDTSGNETAISTKGRHDPCVGIRAVPVVEAMMALVLVDMMVVKL